MTVATVGEHIHAEHKWEGAVTFPGFGTHQTLERFVIKTKKVKSRCITGNLQVPTMPIETAHDHASTTTCCAVREDSSRVFDAYGAAKTHFPVKRSGFRPWVGI